MNANISIRLAGVSLLAILAIAVGFVPAVADSADAAATAEVESLELEIKPLDAPDNPFAGQYMAIDYWAYNHQAKITPSSVHWKKKGNGDVFLVWRINEDGYLLPLMWRALSTDEADIDSLRADNEAGYRALACLWVTEMPPAEIMDAYLAVDERWRAMTRPTVPDWLGTLTEEELPHYTVFLPNGQVAALGEAGVPKEKGPSWENRDEFQWVLYSSDGEMLRKTSDNTYHSLQALLIDNIDDLLIAEFRGDGVLVCNDQDEDGAFYYVDYDGTYLGTEEPPFFWDRMIHYQPRGLLYNYRIQQKYCN
jgi:hypothetical protein